LSGRTSSFNKRRECTITLRSPRIQIASHGRSKRWLEAHLICVADIEKVIQIWELA
jgi:hypothetical protein